jgi:hypothetical protein
VAVGPAVGAAGRRIIAAVLAISGIVTIVRGGLLRGIVLIVVGLLIGPGCVSIVE